MISPPWIGQEAGCGWQLETVVLAASGATVAWILIPLFVAVGLYLVWYSARRRKMLEAFARSHQLFIRPEHLEPLDKTLKACFSLEGEGVVRSFGQLSSLVDGDGVWLFRAVELLDLNPRGATSSTHSPRIAAVFDVPADLDEFFLLDRSMRVTPRRPGSGDPRADVVEMSRRIAQSCQGRHMLSVTLSGGHGLIYFEPLVVGGESQGDIDVLYQMAQKMRDEVAGLTRSRAAT